MLVVNFELPLHAIYLPCCSFPDTLFQLSYCVTYSLCPSSTVSLSAPVSLLVMAVQLEGWPRSVRPHPQAQTWPHWLFQTEKGVFLSLFLLLNLLFSFLLLLLYMFSCCGFVQWLFKLIFFFLAICKGWPHWKPEHSIWGGWEIPGHPQNVGRWRWGCKIETQPALNTWQENIRLIMWNTVKPVYMCFWLTCRWLLFFLYQQVNNT